MSDAEQVLRKARETLERIDDCEAEFATRNATRRPRGYDWGANVPRPQPKGLGEAEIETLVHAAVGKAVAAALHDLNAEVEALAKDVGEVTGKNAKQIGEVEKLTCDYGTVQFDMHKRLTELENELGQLRADLTIETARTRGQIIDIPTLPLRSRTNG